jgi:diguanylate cyclase (GGDEF)-like protein
MGCPVPVPLAGLGGDTLDNTALDILMPMHAQLDNAGRILHLGPTFAKLVSHQPFIKDGFLLNYIRFFHPKNIATVHDLKRYYGAPIIAQIKPHNAFDLKAVAVAMPGNRGIFINFALAASLKDAVAHWHFNSKDFSPADPTVEMLYVLEVQSALLQESRNLNDRLNGQKQEAEEQAYTDPLTGLSNRRALDRYITRMCRRRKHVGFAVFLIDLDHFKLVNDTLGHAAGDRVLREVAEILLNESRPTDIVVRNGGDEFVLVIGDIDRATPLETIAKRIIRKIERPIMWGGQECMVGASIGIVMCDTNTDSSVGVWLQAADKALYASKKNGRGQFQFAN